MQKEDRLINGFSGDNVDGSTNIIPRMGLEPLREGYGRILDQLYAPKFYYERVLTFLHEDQPRRIGGQWDPQYIPAFWRSIYQLGIRGVERVHGSFRWRSHLPSMASISVVWPSCMSNDDRYADATILVY